MANRLGRIIGALCVAVASAAVAPPLRADGAPPADRTELTPKALQNVGIDEKLDAQVPLDRLFADEHGNPVRLREFFGHGRPVILSLNYSNCPMLCSLQLTGLIESLKKLEWSAGREFEVVSVSIDPSEPPVRARQTRDKYVELYGRGGSGWHFLTGKKPAIDAVAESVGFRYQYIPSRNEYAHAAVAVLCTPDGRTSRYLYGISFPEQLLRLSLVEASEGKIGGVGEQLLLFCFHYDPTTGTYAPRAARMAMTVAGCVTILVMGVGLVALKLREPTPDATADATVAAVNRDHERN